MKIEDFTPVVVDNKRMSTQHITLNRWYDLMERSLANTEESLEKMTAEFQRGDYSFSKLIKTAKESIETGNTLWEIVSEDEEHTEYFTIDYVTDMPYIEEIHTVPVYIVAYDTEQNKWVAKRQDETRKVYISVYAYKKSPDLAGDIQKAIDAFTAETKAWAEAQAERSNGDSCETHTCRSCGKPFILTKRELSWFAFQELEPPKRCKECREKRRKLGIHS